MPVWGLKVSMSVVSLRGVLRFLNCRNLNGFSNAYFERILIDREKERLNVVFINLCAMSSEKSLYVIVMAVSFDGVSSATISLDEILYINYITFHVVIINPLFA